MLSKPDHKHSPVKTESQFFVSNAQFLQILIFQLSAYFMNEKAVSFPILLLKNRKS